MGSGGLTGDLSSLVGKTDTALGHLGDTADVGRDILGRIDALLGDLRDLDDTITDQVPGLRDTLQDTKTLVYDMVTTISDTHGFLTSFRSLSKTGRVPAGRRHEKKPGEPGQRPCAAPPAAPTPWGM